MLEPFYCSITHLPSSYIVCHFEKSSSDDKVVEYSCEALLTPLKAFGVLLDREKNRGGANERAREGKQANRATDFKRGTLRSKNEGDCFIPDCAKEEMKYSYQEQRQERWKQKLDHSATTAMRVMRDGMTMRKGDVPAVRAIPGIYG